MRFRSAAAPLFFVSLLLVELLATPTAQAVEVQFMFDPPDRATTESVSVRGSFNGWTETPMTRAYDGTWSVTMYIVTG